MQGMSLNTNSNAIARCPYFSGRQAPAPQTDNANEKSSQLSSDSVTISPFEPADSGPLTKTCVTSAAKATFGMLPGFTKAGCPHAA
jgi:hypothetical protein